MPADVPVQGVLFTVFQSIFQVFLLCLAGFMLSFKDIVDKRTSKALNHINISLFTPALLFSKVAFFLTPAKLHQLWIIPIFFTILTGLSAVVAHWLARVFRLKRSQVNFATAASMFMNSNSLPVALMQSLATTVPLLKWGPDDTVDAMFGRSLTYLVVFSTLGMILRWSYGVHLISQADDPEPVAPPSTTYRDADDADPALPHVPIDTATTTQLVDYEIEATTKVHGPVPRRTRPARSRLSHPRLAPVSWRHTQRYTHPHSHLPTAPTLLGDQSESEESDELETTEGDSEETIVFRSESVNTGFMQAEGPAPVPARRLSSSSPKPSAHRTPRWDRQARSTLHSLLQWLRTMVASLSPPLVASLVAIFCVLVPPVQRLLNSTEMTPFKGAMDNAGACSIPVTLIVLGGWFRDGATKLKHKGGHTPEDEVKDRFSGNAKSKGKGVEKRDRDRGHGNGTALGEERGDVFPSGVEHVTPHSRDSSTGSLSSMIGAVGDVLMAHMRPHGSSGHARWRVGSDAGARKDDVESGLLATHTGTENETAKNGLGRTSRSRSRTDPVNGRSSLSSISSSSRASDPQPRSAHAQGTNPPGETLTIFVTLMARMIIVPLIVTPLIVLVIRLGWGGEVFQDPVFIVSSMLLVSSPPALTLAQISQRAKSGTGAGLNTNADADGQSSFERLLSRTVFWAYCVLTPLVTIASVMIGLLSIRA